MMSEYLSMVSTLVGVVVGFSLQFFASKNQEKTAIQNRLKYLVNDIRMCNVINYLFPKLFELRKFFIQYPDYLKGKNKILYDKWLCDSFVVNQGYKPIIGVGGWSNEKFNELKQDLNKIKI